jgi:peptide/nickel transport system ATP-binding protein
VTQTVLAVSGMTVRFGSGARAFTAVDHVDLAVPAGGTLGLVGESGCGKSTVARALVGLIPVSNGTVSLDGADFSSDRSRDTSAYHKRVQMIFQDPYSSLNPRMSVHETLEEAVGLRGAAYRDRTLRQNEVLRIVDLVGLAHDALDRYPHQFSGGQRQRIAIARALAVGPEVIIADEPTSSLDVSVQATILNLLRDLQCELHLSYLFISHDLSVIRVMSDRVAVMYFGRIVEDATTDEVFAEPRHPYTKALLASIPTLAAQRTRAPLAGDLPNPRFPPAGCRFHSRCPVYGPELAICREEDPQDRAWLRQHRAACHFVEERAGTGA